MSRPTRTAAAIDIGSNSIKMTVGQQDNGGALEQLAWASEMVRLGEGVATTGRLDEQRVEAAIETLHRFVAQAQALEVGRIVAVATEATRAATNGEAFLQLVRDETGIDVRVIDGDEEAALTFRGLSAATPLNGAVLIADIGGGSTELIVARDGVMQGARSLALGSGRLTDAIVRADPPSRDELAACEAEASRALASVADALDMPSGKGSRLIIVGGTGEYLTRLIPDERQFTLSTVREVLSGLETSSAATLAERIGIPEARARVLPAGVAIVAAVANRIVPEAIEIAHSGVRAGLLLETFDQEFSAPALSPPRAPRAGDAAPGVTPSRRDRELDKPEAGFRTTMTALIGDRWADVWNAIPVALAGDDIEGVHDVRVASRRLRAAMDIAAPAYPRGWYKALHRTAKEITGALGEVRDRDVLLEALQADRTAAPIVEHPGIDRLIERVEGERVAARREMEDFLRMLLEGPVATEIERRFGNVRDDRDRSGAARGGKA